MTVSQVRPFSAGTAFGQQFSGRVGVSNDGNQHAPGDIGAAGWIVGIFAKAGARYVHHDYASHLGDNDPDMEARMHSSTIGAARRYYNDTSMYFNDQTDTGQAVANIANQINASSAAGINCIHISNQNANLQVNDMGRWAGAKNSADPDILFLSDIMVGGDISDAGGAYFLVTGMGCRFQFIMCAVDRRCVLWFKTIRNRVIPNPSHTLIALKPPQEYRQMTEIKMVLKSKDCTQMNSNKDINKKSKKSYAK